MINALIGRPGAGKSYEAVVFHIMKALESGRMVVTNLPLNMEYIEAINPEYLRLIKFAQSKRVAGKLVHAFGDLSDYENDWRDDKNRGPLYVIDECHKPFPKGKTPIEIEEYFAEHRHAGIDVLLITQSVRKISVALVDMIQVCYYVSNNRTMGSDKSYVRKVRDGVRGEVMNTTIRRYNKANFNLYKSHTKTDGSVKEAAAADIVPIWKHWTFIGAAICFVLAVGIISTMDINILSPSQPEKGGFVSLPEPPQPIAKNDKSLSVVNQPLPLSNQQLDAEPPKSVHPFSKVQLHISGYIFGKGRHFYALRATQNGQSVFEITDTDLTLAGYKIKPIGRCSVHVSWKDEYNEYLTCDLGRVTVGSVASR